jgi:apolipoprotein D and lipocalin family protein
MKTISTLMLCLGLCGCASLSKDDLRKMTVPQVDIPRFMGNWYVLAGRFTFLEKEVHNALEVYTWNEEKRRVDIAFDYNRGSLTGPVKKIPQKGWIYNTDTNAHWKVSPVWPIKADYLVVALAEDYSWTAIGVPSQKYLWIMARSFEKPEATVAAAVEALKKAGYRHDGLVLVPHGGR